MNLDGISNWIGTNADSIAVLMVILFALLFVLWFAILIDVSKSKFEHDSERLGWTLLVFLGGPITIVLWFVTGRKRRLVERKY
ncbi:MAG: PLDc N-terminal domain-containing protein [Acidobacteria bacterium]|nr:PLDc N-terminal domain-containing protein [Acidobacteriota bacterium]